ncbi:hypothetical protein Riv7116_2222 [Rivularia sp. PCC 7116]|uniref:DUF72 domain-containing protein n=1 Tax=Rivularia sp. PCC 7116 TaxID=373994 RepID=UPI00029F209F|nr:DUF72 domain-containing protein [Rivularia sp. PCC 7116]AFY54745.1 hypothetical protein Riv7116_2222 [Rivularia sp. PCC 7116]
MNFFIGCAVWSYKGWVGEFYPQGTPPKDFLRLYSRRFTTVEGNTTFYALPSQETVKRWAAQTPPEFKFCLKLSRNITHNGSLKPHIKDALKFAEIMRPLDTRLAPIFAQLPPSYAPSSLGDLTAFIEAWQQTQLPLAIEVRHRDWFKQPHADKLTNLLHKFGVGKVILDSRPIYTGENDPQLGSERRKPQLPVLFELTAPFTLIRFISHPNSSINQPFMEEWVTYIKEWLQSDKQIYFFVHCPQEEKSPQTARSFYNLLAQRDIGVSPLPWNQNNHHPKQLSLW